MGLDFVDGQVSCLPVWFPEYTLAIGREFGVKPLQAGLVDALDCALVKPTQQTDFLVRITALQKVFNKRFQL
jgi:hypothetical protein